MQAGNGDLVSWSSLEGLETAMGKDAAKAFAIRLLGFLETKVDETEKAFLDGYDENILNCLHKLASNAAALGALQLSQTARALEGDCREARWEHVKAQREPLIDLARRSLAILRERLG